MTSVEQHKIIKALRGMESRMSRREQEEFEMFVKRDTDDEDLDILSKKKVQDMYERYVLAAEPKGNPLDKLFKK